MIFEIGCPHCNFAELHVDQDSNDGLDYRDHHVHVGGRVEDCALVGQSRKNWDVKEPTVVLGPNHSCCVKEANDYANASDQAGDADRQRNEVEGQALAESEMMIRLVGNR